MENKKKEINLSIFLFFVTAIASYTCWRLKDKNSVYEFFFALTSGICGSSFATLCIFISNYRAEKEKLLQQIFEEDLYIYNHLPSFYEYEEDEAKMKHYLVGKSYMSPVTQNAFDEMAPEEKNFYNACRYIDSFLELGFDRLDQFWVDVNSIDFWSDPIEPSYGILSTKFLRDLWLRKWKKSKKCKILERFYPVYSILMAPCAAENQYIFYWFSDFRDRKRRKAEDVYRLINTIDRKVSGPRSEEEWNNSKDKGLRWELLRTLWTFRDAFYLQNRVIRKRAFKHFMHDKEANTPEHNNNGDKELG